MNRKRITALLAALSLVICTGCTEQEQEVKKLETEDFQRGAYRDMPKRNERQVPQ